MFLAIKCIPLRPKVYQIIQSSKQYSWQKFQDLHHYTVVRLFKTIHHNYKPIKKTLTYMCFSDATIWWKFHPKIICKPLIDVTKHCAVFHCFIWAFIKLKIGCGACGLKTEIPLLKINVHVQCYGFHFATLYAIRPL